MVKQVDTQRLSPTERATIIAVCLGFALVIGFLAFMVLKTSTEPDESAWGAYSSAWRRVLTEFGSTVTQGRRRGAVANLLVSHLILIIFPLIALIAVGGILTGLRGRRTRFAALILRQTHPTRQVAADAQATLLGAIPCATCSGQGFRWVMLASEDGQVKMTCSACAGTGRETRIISSSTACDEEEQTARGRAAQAPIGPLVARSRNYLTALAASGAFAGFASLVLVFGLTIADVSLPGYLWLSLASVVYGLSVCLLFEDVRVYANGFEVKKVFSSRRLTFEEVGSFAWAEQHQMINGINFSSCGMNVWPAFEGLKEIHFSFRIPFNGSDPRLIDQRDRLAEVIARRIFEGVLDRQSVPWCGMLFQTDGLLIQRGFWKQTDEVIPYHELTTDGAGIFRGTDRLVKISDNDQNYYPGLLVLRRLIRLESDRRSRRSDQG
jgi:hypothetical protein